LGAPLAEQTVSATEPISFRSTLVLKGIQQMAKWHPSQALQLLRVTAGACRVEFILQALTPSALTTELAESCSREMQRTIATILQETDISEAVWQLACLPLRMGGLGIRDPMTISSATRLANVINCSKQAILLHTSPAVLHEENIIATTRYLEQLESPFIPELEPDKSPRPSLLNLSIELFLLGLLRPLTTPGSSDWHPSQTPIQHPGPLLHPSFSPSRQMNFELPCGGSWVFHFVRRHTPAPTADTQLTTKESTQ